MNSPLAVLALAMLFVGCSKPRDLNKEMLDAARAGNVRKVRAALREHPELVNARSATGWTPLEWAASNGHRAVVEILLAAGADVNARDNRTETALHWAAFFRRDEVVRLLLGHGADANAENAEGDRPLHLAARNGRGEIIEMLLAHGAKINAQNQEGETALLQTARKGLGPWIVSQLLQRGADPNLKDKTGRTALQWAVEEGHTAMIQILRSAGAVEGEPIAEPKKPGPPPSPARASELIIAAQSGDAAKLKSLLAEHPDWVNATDDDGWAALHYAAVYGDKRLVELLLASKADASLNNGGGATALDLATQKGNQEIADLLRQTAKEAK